MKFTAILTFLLFASCPVVIAGQIISFESLVKDAVNNSYELKIAKHDNEIKKNRRTQAFLSRLPELSFSMSSSYSEQLKDKQNYFFSENNDFSSNSQRYGNVLSVDLNYTLWDYGQYGKQHKLSKVDEKIAQLFQREVVKKLKLQILSTFSQALSSYEEIKLKKEKLHIYDEIIDNSKKIATSGMISSLALITHKRKRLEVEYEILILNKRLEQNLEDLTFFTSQKYQINDISFAHLDSSSRLFLEFDHKLQPEILIKTKEIEIKKTELSIIKAEFFPKLDLKANYKYYGTDPDKYDKSLKDIDDESYSVGLFTSMALFKTAKNYYAYKSGKHEVKKSEVLLTQKVAELNNQFNKYKKEYQSLTKMLDLDKRNLSLVDQNLKMLYRLENEGLIDRAETMEQKISLIDEKTKIRKDIISKSSTIKRFEILTKGFL